MTPSDGSSGSTSGRLPIPDRSGRLTPSSSSGQLPSARGSASGTIRDLSASGRLGRSGALPTRPAPPLVEEAVPRGARWMIYGVVLVVLASVVGFRWWKQHTDNPSSGSRAGLPSTYAMACRVCGERFDMDVLKYRERLAARKNRSANRIRCPKCNADDAAYRRESGMEGLGELNGEGSGPINPRIAAPDQ